MLLSSRCVSRCSLATLFRERSSEGETAIKRRRDSHDVEDVKPVKFSRPGGPTRGKSKFVPREPRRRRMQVYEHGCLQPDAADASTSGRTCRRVLLILLRPTWPPHPRFASRTDDTAFHLSDRFHAIDPINRLSLNPFYVSQ